MRLPTGLFGPGQAVRPDQPAGSQSFLNES